MAAGKYLRGETLPITAPVLTAQAVEVADLCATSSGNVVRAEDVTWGTAVATPSAPTVAASAATRGTALTNALTGVKVSVQFPWGEGALSAAGTATPTAAFGLKVTLAALPSPGLYWNVYVETAAGSGVFQLQQTTAISAGIIYVDSYGTGAVPAASPVASGALELTQYTFAQAFLGVSGQRKVAAVARVAANGQDNVIRIDADGMWEFDCASATFVLGDYIGAAKATGNTLHSQKLVGVAGEALAIARCEVAGTSLTRVKVKMLSKTVPQARQS